VSAFVQSVGTSGSLPGISTRLRVHNEAVHVVAVEPEESAVLSGRPSGSHKIDGDGLDSGRDGDRPAPGPARGTHP